MHKKSVLLSFTISNYCITCKKEINVIFCGWQFSKFLVQNYSCGFPENNDIIIITSTYIKGLTPCSYSVTVFIINSFAYIYHENHWCKCQTVITPFHQLWCCAISIWLMLRSVDIFQQRASITYKGACSYQ